MINNYEKLKIKICQSKFSKYIYFYEEKVNSKEIVLYIILF